MKFVTYDFSDKLDHLYILAIGDWHIGDVLFDEKILKEFLQWVDENNAYIFLTGDLIENATKNSPSDCYRTTMSPSQQLDIAEDIIRPYRERLLAVVSGNHEWRSRKEVDYEPLSEMVLRLGGRKLRDKIYDPDGITVLIRLGHFNRGKIPYSFYITHGKHLTTNKRAHDVVDVDCYVCGHNHEQEVKLSDFFRLDDRHNKLNQVKRFNVRSGSFRNYGGYEQRSTYPPAHKGAPRLRLDGLKKDLHIEV